MKTISAFALISLTLFCVASAQPRPLTRKEAIDFGHHDGDTWGDIEEDDVTPLRKLIKVTLRFMRGYLSRLTVRRALPVTTT